MINKIRYLDYLNKNALESPCMDELEKEIEIILLVGIYEKNEKPTFVVNYIMGNVNI